MRDGVLLDDLHCPSLDEKTCGKYPAYFYGKKMQFTHVKTSLKKHLEEPLPAVTDAPVNVEGLDPERTGLEERKDPTSQQEPAEEVQKDAEQRPDESLMPAHEKSPDAKLELQEQDVGEDSFISMEITSVAF